MKKEGLTPEEELRDKVLSAWSKVHSGHEYEIVHALSWFAEAIEVLQGIPEGIPLADRLASVHDAMTDLSNETADIAERIFELWREMH